MQINVVNKRKHKSNGLPNYYIGRPSVLGNPYSHISGDTKASVLTDSRETAIEGYRTHFDYHIVHSPDFIREVSNIKRIAQLHGGIKLVCWCAPLGCHGDIIKQHLENKMSEVNKLSLDGEYIPYAGVGSRNTPENILDEMFVIAEQLSQIGFTLRTGGALGADTAFAEGIPDGSDSKLLEVFLPWYGYNNWESPYFKSPQKAFDIARITHPNWSACTQGVQKLMARNVQIVLGEKLDDPVDFLICYTPNGEKVGGTAHAITLAEKNNIPIFNLGDTNLDLTIEMFWKFIEETYFGNNQ